MDMLRVPHWIKFARREDDDMADDIDMPPPPPPPVAMLPEPVVDEELTIMQRAAALHAQMKRTIETAQVELAESVLGRQGDQEKIRFLEKENAELRLDIAQLQNDRATLQVDLTEKDRCLSLLQQVLNKFGTKAPPKKERKPKLKKNQPAEGADGQATSQATQAHGSINEQ